MYDFIITPAAGAVIGYFTNWLAIKMLFRPYTQKRVCGIALPFTPGLIPKERHRLSEKIGETVSKYLVTNDMIRSRVLSDGNTREIEQGLRVFLEEAKEPAVGIIMEKLTQARERVIGGSGAFEYLPPDTPGFIERVLYENMPKAAVVLRDLPPELSEKFVELTGKVIDEAVGRLAAVFINRERVYDSIIKSLCEYMDDEANRAALSERLSGQIVKLLNDPEMLKHVPWDTRLLENTVSRVVDLVFDMTANEFLRSDTVKTGLAHAIGGAFANIDVGKMAEEQINSMDMSEVEGLVVSVAKRELQTITVIGGVLGFIIGLVPGVLRMLA